MTEHPSKLLLQTLDRAKELLYPHDPVQERLEHEMHRIVAGCDKPCTDTPEPNDIIRNNPSLWRAWWEHEWTRAHRDLALRNMDRHAWLAKYPAMKAYYTDPGRDDGPDWADWPATERIDGTQ